MRSPKIEGGYILISRQVIESEIWEKPPLYFKVWMYLLARAQYKSYRGLERGETIITIPELIEACSWKVGYRTEKPTKAQIFNILEWLRNSHEDEYEDVTSDAMISTFLCTLTLPWYNEGASNCLNDFLTPSDQGVFYLPSAICMAASIVSIFNFCLS